MATVGKRRLKMGDKWEARWTDTSSKRRTKLFSRKKDAVAFIDQVKRQISDGVYVSDSQTVTVEVAGSAYVADAIRRGVRAETYREYERHLRKHICPKVGELKLTELRQAHILEVIDGVLARCSASTAKAVLRTFRAVINEGQKRDWVGRNIIIDKSIRVEVKKTEHSYFPTKGEIKKLIECASDEARIVLKTALLTGVRQGELRALTWADIDFEHRILRVRRSATKRGELKEPKTVAGKRDIPLSEDLCCDLKKWRDASPKTSLGLMFPDGRGRIRSAGNVRHMIFLPAMRKAGFVDAESKTLFRFHDLRHATASLLIERNLNAKRIQYIMGHSDTQTTFDVYGKLFKDAAADLMAVDAIGDELKL